MSLRVAANCPELTFEIDFTNDPSNPTRAYTDITSDVRSLDYVRGGRSHELQRTETGTLTATLNNRHGDYDSTNTTSPHYPGVKRMRWCRVRAHWAATAYTRWTGLVETWQQEWPAFGKDALVTVTAADAFKVLNLFDLDGLSYGSHTTGTRVEEVADDIGLPHSIDTGQTTLPAIGPFDEGSMSLPHLLEVENSENGLLFAAGDGTIVFQGRHHRLLGSAVPVDTIGDVLGEIPYRTGELLDDDSDLWNTVSVTPDGGTPEVATDTVSVAEHYERRLNRSTLASSQTEALASAQFNVQRYGDPAPRIPRIELLGAKDTSKWPAILGAANSDRFTWRRSAVNVIELDVFVERVADSVEPGHGWSVRFELSPAEDQAGWSLGDPTYGLLGVSTVLVY